MKKYLIMLSLFLFSSLSSANDELPKYFHIKNVNEKTALSLSIIDYDLPGLMQFIDVKDKNKCRYLGEFTKQGYIHISKKVCSYEGVDKISDVDLFAFEKTLPRSPSEYRFDAGSEFFIVKPENIIPRKPNFFEKVLNNGK